MDVRLCRIVGAGDFAPELIDKSVPAYYIAADGGLLSLRKAGIEPDIIAGDFDSLGFVPQGDNVLRFPREKDDTDVGLAVKHGLKSGFTVFELYGVTGGRLDHTLANLQILSSLSLKGCAALIKGTTVTATAVTNGTVGFYGSPGDTVSVFAFNGEARGVTLTGFKYPLTGAALRGDYPIGVSNKLTGTHGTVTVASGTVTVTANTVKGKFIQESSI